MRSDQVKAQIQAMAKAGMSTAQIAQKVVVVKSLCERQVQRIIAGKVSKNDRTS
jgi:IS30 family transposase